jgi:hypothetical protein
MFGWVTCGSRVVGVVLLRVLGDHLVDLALGDVAGAGQVDQRVVIRATDPESCVQRVGPVDQLRHRLLEVATLLLAPALCQPIEDLLLPVMGLIQHGKAE